MLFIVKLLKISHINIYEENLYFNNSCFVVDYKDIRIKYIMITPYEHDIHDIVSIYNILL